MTTRQVLLRLQDQLESSIIGTTAVKQEAISLGNYQAVVNFEYQVLGRQFALALINEELDRLIE